MAEVTAQSRIEAPAAKLWSQLTDWDAYGQWSMTHTNFPQGGPQTLAVGSTFAENMKMMGFPAEVVWTVSELEDERLFAITGKGPMGVAVLTRYTLTPDGGATTVRIDGEFTGAAVSLMAGKLKDSATAALNESLRKLAGLVA
ncbi:MULTISPECIES: type II toxin-antitoxin system Rv0910 family toxin [Streptomyces]|uniref:Polyketide cyclase n=1 Tax=Streptomyces virginiae TaxID=1961 RepID=A0ABQ3NKD1_STRVG|nr:MULTISPECIES: SRPBCC family protein [Streptomyces]KOU18047.1 polyketide cyclase [Streptomyces sp. WM6349]KOU88152.1 polyketide cyclase [Streptomyces sp. XY593]KOU95667.1 polyketide cyclase [Streptomyces sp. XY533]KOV03456.1 polyketide cyclase [Streptomyces sp. XY511]KOV44056.1 polyketide cyclase [Streptomyces sp. H036]